MSSTGTHTPIPTVTNTPLPPPTATATPTNWPPQAQDDHITVNEDQTVRVDVLKNDSDRDGDIVRLLHVDPPAHGFAAIEQNQIRYSPADNYHGPDAFRYRVGDGKGVDDDATVHVTVRPVNDAPDTAPDFAATSKNRTVLIAVLANDRDVDGDSLRIVSVTAPEHGTASLQPDQRVLYTPDNGYFGPDTFTYRVSDGVEERSETVEVGVSAAEGEFRLWVDPSSDEPIQTGQIVRIGIEFRNVGTVPLTDVVLKVNLPIQAEVLRTTLAINAEVATQGAVSDASASADTSWTVASLEVGQSATAIIYLRIDAEPGDAPTVTAELTVKQLSETPVETMTYRMEQTVPLSVLAYREGNGLLLTWQVPSQLAPQAFSVWHSQAPRWRGATRLSEVTARDDDVAQDAMINYECQIDAPQPDAEEYVWIEEVEPTGRTVVHGSIPLSNLEYKGELLFLPTIQR